MTARAQAVTRKKLYVLYDERANYDLDAAAVLSTADTLREAKADRAKHFPRAVIYEYDVRDSLPLNGKVVR